MRFFPFSKSVADILKNLYEKSTIMPAAQLYKLGFIYSSYRVIISIFLFLSSYVMVFQPDTTNIILPSLLQQIILLFYCIFSLFLLGLFFFVPHFSRQQLGLGLIIDVIILSLLLYINGPPDLQITMLYMVVVAASFMLLPTYQGAIVTLLAVIFVIYQQFFYAITNSLSLANVGDALLLSLSFLGVGFISWSIAQRLAQVEKIAATHALEVKKLNAVNQEVISKMTGGVLVINKNLDVVLCNEAAVYMLNILPNDNNGSLNIHGRELYEFVSNKIKSQLVNLCQWFETASRLSRTQTIYNINSSTSMTDKLRLSTIPLQDGSLLVLIEDLRREQTNAQQLKLASLGQLTASIAHEIRNPLATISQASQLLLEDVETIKTGTQNLTTLADAEALLAKYQGNGELYEMIFQQTKRVNHIIQDVLKLSKQTKPDQSYLPIQPWLEKFITDHYQHQQVSLNMNCDTHIYFDPHQLEQVLINLINNGLRFSAKAHGVGTVEVMVYCINNDVIIDILDDGAGVTESQLPNLFHPFFTTDNEGTGLGLYLSQAFTEANHARLIYVPEHDKTCFRIMLPHVAHEAKC
ncbi:sensor histidine kinase [Psychrobacter sp. I-STPA10]|uniref:sensor histidine kinase n=1 Tax=Psychrobacter sp. I-STPA10 TaxID=2585769 RepID=UPI001E337551|nr:ATP-binding protein [Psychrobacter sp. I-STPA10]